MAVKFLQGRMSVEGLKSFVQGELGEPWEDQTDRGQRTEIMVRGDDLEKPIGDDLHKLLTVDVQMKEPFFWWVVRSWAKNGNSRLVACGHCDQWEQVAQTQKDYEIDDRHVLVDSGYDASTVYRECLSHGKMIAQPGMVSTHKGWLPCKGRDKTAGWIDPKSRQPRLWTIVAAPLERRGTKLPLILFNSDAMRDVLLRLRRCETKIRWELTDAAGTEYFAHMDAYTRKPVVSGRKVTIAWAPRSQHRPDHLLDCELMQLVGAMLRDRLPWSCTPGRQAEEITLPT
jgi:hypothetical protein